MKSFPALPFVAFLLLLAAAALLLHQCTERTRSIGTDALQIESQEQLGDRGAVRVGHASDRLAAAIAVLRPFAGESGGENR